MFLEEAFEPELVYKKSSQKNTHLQGIVKGHGYFMESQRLNHAKRDLTLEVGFRRGINRN